MKKISVSEIYKDKIEGYKPDAGKELYKAYAITEYSQHKELVIVIAVELVIVTRDEEGLHKTRLSLPHERWNMEIVGTPVGECKVNLLKIKVNQQNQELTNNHLIKFQIV